MIGLSLRRLHDSSRHTEPTSAQRDPQPSAFLGYDGRVILSARRLTLVACPLETAQALLANLREAGRILGAEIPSGWPSPEIEEILPLYIQELIHDPEALGWGIWIVIHRGENVVGAAGFKGRPDAEGTVEIGYGVAPACRGQGYATEAVQALVGWAFSHPEVKRVVAECAPDNPASIRVLDKAGFRLTGRSNGALYWEMARRV